MSTKKKKGKYRSTSLICKHWGKILNEILEMESSSGFSPYQEQKNGFNSKKCMNIVIYTSDQWRKTICLYFKNSAKKFDENSTFMFLKDDFIF